MKNFTFIKLRENLNDYMKEIEKYPVLNSEEERVLLEKIKKGDKDAYIKLVECNLKLVVYVARKYLNMKCKLSKMDLIQEGNIGLMKAIEKYDLNRHTKFSTMAYYWINIEIQRAIQYDGYTIRIPSNKHENIAKYDTAFKKLEKEFWREPTEEELESELGFKISEVKYALFMMQPTSLNALIGDEHEIELDYYLRESKPSILDEIVIKDNEVEKSNLIKKILLNSGLSKGQLEVMMLKYGLVDGKYKTSAEVSKILNISKQAVCDREQNAIIKLRKSSYINELSNLTEHGKLIKKS